MPEPLTCPFTQEHEARLQQHSLPRIVELTDLGVDDE
jgi:hypothetical protein